MISPPAVAVNSASRCGTFFFGSPSSCASAQMSACGSVGTQRIARGPVGTPSIGTLSCSGSSATVPDFSPLAAYTSTARGNAEYG